MEFVLLGSIWLDQDDFALGRLSTISADSFIDTTGKYYWHLIGGNWACYHALDSPPPQRMI